MKNSLSTKKRTRQTTKKTLHNQHFKSEAKTYLKNFRLAVQKKDDQQAQHYWDIVVKKLDKLSQKGILHKNTVARKKSRAHKLLLAMNQNQNNS